MLLLLLLLLPTEVVATEGPREREYVADNVNDGHGRKVKTDTTDDLLMSRYYSPPSNLWTDEKNLKGRYYKPPFDPKKKSKKKNTRGGKKQGKNSKNKSGSKSIPMFPFPVTSNAPRCPPSLPTSTPPAPPVAKSTPSPVQTIRSCEPTTGQCVSTADQLQTVLNAAAANATIAICGTDQPIVTRTAVTLAMAGTTLCCAGPGGCIFQSNGTDHNLIAFGDSVKLQDLIFANGYTGVAFGGNVAIDGAGDHVVVGCEFRNGSASQSGGNLFVQTSGSVSIEDSIFIGGDAAKSGGGLYVLNAKTLTIKGSTFSGNRVRSGSGGAIYSVVERVANVGQSQSIVFENTTFVNNSANVGGGFFVTHLGSLPSLSILNCGFQNNEGFDAAGAGAMAISLNNLTLALHDSIGDNNNAPICPDLLGFYDDSTEPLCILVSTNFP